MSRNSLEVAVIVIAHVPENNGPRVERLLRALTTIRQQESRPAETVVVSVSEQPGVAEDGLACLPRGALYLECPGAGLGEAMALGVARTRAPLLAFADGEGLWAENKLSAQSAAFARPGLELVGHREEYRPPLGQMEVLAEHFAERDYCPLLAALRRPAFAWPTAMIRRTTWARLGGVREGGPSVLDGDADTDRDSWQAFLIRAVRSGVPIATLELPLVEVGVDRPDWPEPPPEFGSGPAEPTFPAVRSVLRDLRHDELFAAPPSHPRSAAALKAGLHLLYDDLEGCHAIAQANEGYPECDYWHALMHRREGDFSNSGYWFTRLGEHPIFPELYQETLTLVRAKSRQSGLLGEAAADLAGQLEELNTWKPTMLAGLIQRIGRASRAPSARAAAELARRVQLLEFNLLLRHCHRTALGN